MVKHPLVGWGLGFEPRQAESETYFFSGILRTFPGYAASALGVPAQQHCRLKGLSVARDRRLASIQFNLAELLTRREKVVHYRRREKIS
jgi:hypothetical protein